jgi:hypothetical protein
MATISRGSAHGRDSVPGFRGPPKGLGVRPLIGRRGEARIEVRLSGPNEPILSCGAMRIYGLAIRSTIRGHSEVSHAQKSPRTHDQR